jgi:hypothetical protein
MFKVVVSVVGLLLVPNVVCHNIRGKYSAGDMMQPIRRHPKHDTLGMFLPYSDPVVNVPAEFSPANEGGRTNFRNPASNPHSLGLPYSPAGEHNTWPSPAEGYDPRMPAVHHGSAAFQNHGNFLPMIPASNIGPLPKPAPLSHPSGALFSLPDHDRTPLYFGPPDPRTVMMNKPTSMLPPTQPPPPSMMDEPPLPVGNQ